jgi:hypothetical protein
LHIAQLAFGSSSRWSKSTAHVVTLVAVMMWWCQSGPIAKGFVCKHIWSRIARQMEDQGLGDAYYTIRSEYRPEARMLADMFKESSLKESHLFDFRSFLEMFLPQLLHQSARSSSNKKSGTSASDPLLPLVPPPAPPPPPPSPPSSYSTDPPPSPPPSPPSSYSTDGEGGSQSDEEEGQVVTTTTTTTTSGGCTRTVTETASRRVRRRTR